MIRWLAVIATETLAPPEPGLTPAEMLRRAQAMRLVLRERQAACEAAGRILDETNDEFVRAGFYRIIQPRRFGGYEFDLTTFVQVMMEVSRGCPESGWVLALTAGHPIIMVKFPEQAQREAFGSTGEFRAPGVAAPGGKAIPVDGGYRVKGAWDYSSGCDISTHFLGAAFLADPKTGAPGGMAFVLLDRDQYSILDNWRVIGMQGTGSRRVVLEETFIPAHRVLPYVTAEGRPVVDHPGHAAHRNSMYHGRVTPLLISELAAVAIGAARGALDLYEEIMRTKRLSIPPFLLRSESPEYLRHYGSAQVCIDVAEAALLKVAADYMEFSRRQVEEGIPFDDERERRLLMMEQHAVRLAWDAADLMFRTAGTSSTAAQGAPLGRYVRNLQVIRTHITQQYDHTALNAGCLHFGLPPYGSL